MWGALTRALTAFLDFVESLTGSYGLAIIVFTIVVKTALYPFTLKQQKALAEQKKYTPELQKIQEKYKKQPEELQKKTMEFYRKHNYNPLGACLPLVLQLPFIWLLFGVIKNHEFDGQGFLWVPLLTARDPYYIWPLLSVAFSFAQNKMQEKINPPTGANPSANSMSMAFPIFIGLISVSFPAGLVIYWTMNTLVTIVQSYIINKRLAASMEEVQNT